MVAGAAVTPLAPLPPTTAGVAKVIADVAAIRALAAGGDDAAARAVLDVGFAPETMIYRDEVGRRLRAMAPVWAARCPAR